MLASRPDGMEVARQPWSLGRRIATSALAFTAIGFIVFAAAGSSDEGRLRGAGSTLANPILQRVSTSYQGYLAADRVDPAQQQGNSADWVAGAGALDYDPVGSVGGLVRLDDPATVFAVTEVPMSPADLNREGRMQFPLILGATAPVVNLDLGGGTLVLDAGLLSAIYSGQITRWSDPAIAALNGGAALPDQPIAVHHRSDGSGSSWTFTGYLAQEPGWAPGQAAQMDWPVGEGAKGSRGMIDAVKAVDGAIGYAEVGQASRAGLKVVRLVDAGGRTVEPSPETIRAAATVDGWSAETQATPPDSEGWPMTATVYVVMRKDEPQNPRALAFFRYFYAEAARRADVLGYVPLPDDTVRAIEAHWGEILNKQS
ncbi:extracellular solute-binding protein [Cereibacter sp. SYSU M97828]|nr:extracellular solute-binding protein [Cereibacter flavus]